MNEAAVTLRALTDDAGDLQELQRVLEEAPAYAERLTGSPATAAEAQSLCSALPPGKSYEDKCVLGIFVDRRMVGCIDVVRGYPNATTAMLGLLLISENHRRLGIGRRAYAALERFVLGWGACDRVRIGVVRTNADVEPFWRGLGFVPNGEVKPYRHGSIASEILVFEKLLDR